MLYLSKEDSLDVYLIKVNDYKKVDDVAPIDYIYDRIEEILQNRKKVDFIKKFETWLPKPPIEPSSIVINNL